MHSSIPLRFLRSVAWAAVVATVAQTHVAAAASVSALVQVSGPSPFSRCTAGGTSGQPSTNVNYDNSAVEPSVAVNAQTVGTDHVNLVGAWQQDRWSTGAARGLVAGYSFDGGKTWGETPLPFSTCASGDQSLLRASDPWVSIGSDGTAYAVAISFGSTRSDVVAASSTDGGKTWGSARKIIDDTTAFNDKESVTADPLRPGRAYVVWDRTGSYRNAPQPALFSKTVDGGKTWSKAKTIVPMKAPNSGTIGNQIVVDPRTGVLYDVYLSFAERAQYRTTCKTVQGKKQCRRVRKIVQNPQIDAAITVIRSRNGGKTWSAPTHITPLRYTAIESRAEGSLRTGGGLPQATIDPTSGELYVVWATGAFSRGSQLDVALSRSSDGGKHWTVPIQVNTPRGRDAFTPSVAVNSSGTVGVTYYDLRAYAPGGTSIPAQYWFTSSKDGGTTFGDETHLAGPFDMKSAPLSGGYFLGDYQGLVAVDTAFAPFFSVANTGNASNPTAIYATTVAP
ncbi:MAG: sialidase family protein [Chloroflexota bacterium]